MDTNFLLDNFEVDEFGQRPTPPAGSQITEIKIKDEDHNGYFDKIKHRFVWFPLHDVNFLGKMQIQPMSFPHLYKGRTAWVQAISYKAVDNSPEAMDIDGDGELPLKNFLLTPYAQALYLEGSYAEKGMVSFEHLKGAEPQFVSHLEQVILPKVPGDLLSLGKYLAEQSGANIEAAGLGPTEKRQAKEMLVLMQKSVNTAINYCRALVEESEAEILTRRNKGVGKAAFDRNDRYAFKMLRKDVPTENTIENSPDRKLNELLTRLVAAMEGANRTPIPVQVAEAKDEEIASLRGELDSMRQQLADVLFAVKNLNLTGAPTVDDTTVVDTETIQNDLKARLSEVKGNPRKAK